MITFKQFTLLKKFQKNNLGIDRKKMPQVFSKDISKFKQFLTKNKILFNNGECKPKELKMAQEEINPEKIIFLTKHPEQLLKTVIISKDNYILDGNHRVATLLILDKNVKYLQIQMNIKDLIKKVKSSFDQVSYKNINEKENT